MIKYLAKGHHLWDLLSELEIHTNSSCDGHTKGRTVLKFLSRWELWIVNEYAFLLLILVVNSNIKLKFCILMCVIGEKVVLSINLAPCFGFVLFTQNCVMHATMVATANLQSANWKRLFISISKFCHIFYIYIVYNFTWNKN